jgi:hypothetical protein
MYSGTQKKATKKRPPLFDLQSHPPKIWPQTASIGMISKPAKRPGARVINMFITQNSKFP